MACIWYVSKYVVPPTKGRVGGRGYLIMRELAKTGHECVIITSNSNQLAETPVMSESYLLQHVDGMQMWWVNTIKYRVAKSARRILSWVHFEWRLWQMPKAQMPPPDAIIVSSLSLLTIVNGLLLRRRYGARLVFEVRDIWPLTLTEEGGFGPRNPFVLMLSYLEKLAYRRADAIVGTMPNLGEHVSEVLGKVKLTHCIPMGVDETSLSISEELPDEYASMYIPAGKFIVAHVGTIGITNAVETLLQCADQMKDNSSVHFLFVGDGDLRSHFQNKYAYLKNVTFAPRVPKAKVPAVLAHCDVLYFSTYPSKVWHFGQSLNKLVDYMMAGKPIVGSYTGFPSMINEAKCGSFVEAGDVDSLCLELERYTRMPQHERQELGERGRKWILANRQYARLAQDYLEILFNKTS
jgi:glycosyltransferase involved in cell wall biosynthesis